MSFYESLLAGLTFVVGGIWLGRLRFDPFPQDFECFLITIAL